jgi:hypothetical protein
MVGNKMSQSFPAQWTAISVPPGVDTVLDVLPKSTAHARVFLNGVYSWWSHRHFSENPYHEKKLATGFFNAWNAGWAAANEGKLILKTKARVGLMATAPPENQAKTSQKCPCTGNLCQIMVNFPPGCRGLAEVTLLYSDRLLYPPIESLSVLDSASATFDVGQFVLKDEEISMQINNRDTVWPHTIAAACFIEYEGKWQNEEEP